VNPTSTRAPVPASAPSPERASEPVSGKVRRQAWRIGARELARFALRRGDLEFGPTGPDAQAGQRAHRRLQEASGLEAEVVLSRTVSIEGQAITVAGRIDLRDVPGRRLIEIKSTLVPLERLPPGRRALDRAQLELYAWLHADEAPEGLADTGECRSPIKVLELQYMNLRDDVLQCERWSVDDGLIAGQVQRALVAWHRFQRGLQQRDERAQRTAAQLPFPFQHFRPGQRRLSAAVYRAQANRQALLLEAPTGTGKTLGVLYPAVRTLAPDGVRRLLWLTAKASGRDAFFAALRHLIAGGLRIDALLMRSRRDACFCERDPSLRDDEGRCGFAHGFHDRLPAARQQAIEEGASGSLLDGQALDRLGSNHRICPHALALELLPWATVVVCDYNHLFDPLASLPSVLERIDSAAVLIDEAHNLPDRARQMYTVRLSRLEVLAARTAVQGLLPTLARALDRLAASMLASCRASIGEKRSGDSGNPAVLMLTDQPPRRLERAVRGVLDAAAETAVAPLGDAVGPMALPKEMLLALHRFAAIVDRFDETDRCVTQRRTIGRRQEVLVELLCLDARVRLGRVLRAARTTVAFSAVLGPMAECRDALGLEVGSTVGIRGESPFQVQQLHCQLIDWIPVRFGQRDAALPALLELIVATVDARRGHYLVFLPSHAWLEQVARAFAHAYPDRSCWQQPRTGASAQLAERLALLDRPGASVGFVITGGVFGEGVDYTGDRLVGAIVVGTALPGRDARTALMIEHHQGEGRSGYDLVCRHPALVRVLQSAGRLIRGPRDRGVLLLVDERFDDAFQRRWRPSHWRVERPVDQGASTRGLERFWLSHACN